MRKYLAFFRLRFSMGLQYRAAAVAGIVTQFFWGAMELLAFRAFYQADPGAFPMSFQATASYVWMQQAFLTLFAAWMFENEIFQCIRDGSVAYELCRPVDLYAMWFARSAANRVSRAVLRCAPILLVAAFLPAPLGMTAPQSLSAFLWWAVTMVLGLAVTVGFGMLIYLTTFFTLSPDGVRMVAVSLVEILQGGHHPSALLPRRPAAVFRAAALCRHAERAPAGLERRPLRGGPVRRRGAAAVLGGGVGGERLASLPKGPAENRGAGRVRP